MKFRVLETCYVAGRIHEPGTTIDVELAGKVPPYLELVKRHPLDHDGDGRPGGSLPRNKVKADDESQ